MIVSFIILLVLAIILYQIIGEAVITVYAIAFVIFIIWLWWKKYRPVIGYTMLVSGAPGTGKTKLITDFALHKYKSTIFRWKLKRKSKRGMRPVLCSNYPIVVGKKKKKDYKLELEEWKKQLEENPDLRKPVRQLFSVQLEPKYILLHEKLPKGSVYAISEIGSLINNQDYKNPYAKINVDEWVRFIRQYGYSLYADDQSSDNVEVHVRRRFNKLYNLQDYWRLWGLGIGITRVRHMSISEDIKVIEVGHSEDIKKNTSWLPLFWWRKTYDSYAFSERIDTVPDAKTKQFTRFKTNQIPVIPIAKKIEDVKMPLTNSKD